MNDVEITTDMTKNILKRKPKPNADLNIFLRGSGRISYTEDFNSS